MPGLFSIDLTGLIARPACLDFCVDTIAFAPGFAGDTSTGSAHRPSGLERFGLATTKSSKMWTVFHVIFIYNRLWAVSR